MERFVLLSPLLWIHYGQALCAVGSWYNIFWEHYACCLRHFMCWAVMSLQTKESLSEIVERK